ncbi:hypothetical protein [Ralstonia insidiosa]|uniref:Uncharacterized protein n=1 Tax=Ralstonia insidiosa TaxID=190721 RepID=A0A848P0P1_9RALS|nr:hypothetical protein [Ralstonia insidiosa]NMV37258.1 hypothetical protein [Ralstonia insidiosa]
MTVRAKLTLQSVTNHAWSPDSKTLKFGVQYDASIPEDQKFCKATPSGQIEIQIDNPAAVSQFELGKSYYVDFTPA